MPILLNDLNVYELEVSYGNPVDTRCYRARIHIDQDPALLAGPKNASRAAARGFQGDQPLPAVTCSILHNDG